LYGSVIFFSAFVLNIVIFRTASGVNSYTKVNRAFIKFLASYVLFSITISIFSKVAIIESITSIILGSFIFTSLYYVYLFSLIGIAKKSISINILFAISELTKLNSKTDLSKLWKHLENQGLSFSSIRNNRLEQMLYLNFATMENNTFKLSKKGKLTNYILNCVLRIWRLDRL